MTAALFPLLYLTLELPKRIINDAIGSRSSVIDVLGFEIPQIEFLLILCFAFLLSVLAHGLLKMRINTMKGVLAERMLRRLRYQLISRILCFPGPYFERVSQGELVSMVTAESEPMGGLMGDALSQPVLQAGQMLTILAFLFVQSFWFGLSAVALIPLQAWLIPKLQRQINLLNKTRIQEVRGLAAEIGESAAGAPTLRVNGGWRYRMAIITDRLARLFSVRFDIYQKKFFMKFINNFIGQLTPFFFYSVGGFLVLQGSVTIGALVAALSAYKDLSSPWKELLAYYNQTQDMSLRWEVIVERFAPSGMLDESLIYGEPGKVPQLSGDVVLDQVTVRDPDGNPVLENISMTMPSAGVVAIAAASEEDRRAMADLLTREVTPSIGSVYIGDQDLSQLHQAVIAARIGHASSRPVMFRGSFGDNILMPLRPRPVHDDQFAQFMAEAKRAGNSPDPVHADWLDPSMAGRHNADELRDWWVALIEGMGSGRRLFRRALEQKFDPAAHPELTARLIELRPTVQQAIRDAGLQRHVHFFSPDLYNHALPVAENMLFATSGVPVTADMLTVRPAFLARLRQLRVDQSLVDISRDVVDMLHQIFGMDGTDHPLFRNLGLDPETYERALELAGKSRASGASALTSEELAQLVIVPANISAEQIGLTFPDEVQDHILRMRHDHSDDLLAMLNGIFKRLDIREHAQGLTVLENAMFGKLSDNAGSKGEEIRNVVADLLTGAKLRELILHLIYEVPITLGGANVPALFAESLSFSRATIKRPDLLIMEQALSSYDVDTRQEVHEKLRQLLPDTLLVYLNESFENPDAFDLYVEIQQGQIVTDELETAGSDDEAASANLSRKVRALETTPLFSGLNRKQMRLLAFGARWYHAPKGEVVFNKGDPARDGAYMVIEGEVGLHLPQADAKDTRIATVGPGGIVGELGLIRKLPRVLTMVAETDITCLRIGEEEFLAVVENDAATAFKLLQVVAGYVSS